MPGNTKPRVAKHKRTQTKYTKANIGIRGSCTEPFFIDGVCTKCGRKKDSHFPTLRKQWWY